MCTHPLGNPCLLGVQYAAFMTTQSFLNQPQIDAVEHLGSPLLVLAGAGSGKTRVITFKIAHLIREGGIAPRNIAAVTFTNKAAREMKERLAGLLEGKTTHGLMVCTFHSLGLTMIRAEHRHLGYRRGFSILDPQDSETVLRELTQKESSDYDVPALQWRISTWKNNIISPQQAQTQVEDDTSFNQAKLYARYQRQLLAYNALDFDDLIMQPVHLLSQYADIRQRWQHSIRHLLIDEYQDTNVGQYLLMKLLMDKRDGLTVVGDDDQSIYAWRGARPENISLLGRDFPNLKIIKLEQNYRSNDRILKTANRLIANNPHLFEKQLWSDQGLGDFPRIIPCKSPQQEAQHIVGDILRLRFKRRDNFSDYAILYRSNHLAKPLEQALREHHIPYKLSGGMSFFERAEIKDLIAYLRLLVNPEDDPAFLRIVNTPRREIGPATLEKLGIYATQRNKSLFMASQELGFTQQLPTHARLRLEQFSSWLQAMKNRTANENPANLTRRVIDDIAYADWLRNTSKNQKTAQKRLENVQELLDWMARLTAEKNASAGLSDIVGHMALLDIIDRHQDERTIDAVNLMTLHAAKGLEFSCVWIAGLEEELLPHHSSLDGAQLEEERRLFYVGITRAKEHLTMSFAASRTRYGEQLACRPSRFLDELPQEHIVWADEVTRTNSTKTRETGKAHLANLKAILDH